MLSMPCSSADRQNGAVVFVLAFFLTGTAQCRPTESESYWSSADSEYYTGEAGNDIGSARNGQGLDGFACPATCTCFGISAVDCTKGNYTELPAWDTSTEQSGTRNSSTALRFPKFVYVLFMGFNDIKRLPNHCLQSSGQSLETLYLQNNSISEIQPLAFGKLEKLKYLELSNNRLATLTYADASSGNNASRPPTLLSVFSPLKRTLISLQLSFNRIRELPNELFAGLVKLEILGLANNNITWIGRDALKDLVGLKKLILRGNPLSRPTVFAMDEILAWLVGPRLPPFNDQLDQCPATENHVESRRRRRRQNSIPNTGPKKMGPDVLEILDLGELGLQSVPEFIPSSVRILMLDHNRIRDVPPDSFRYSERLQLLNMAGNRVGEIPAGTFGENYELRFLDLSRNDLRNLTANSFCGAMTLQVLRLHWNPNLSHLPAKIFSKTSFLRLLSLQNCGLRKLPTGPWIHRLRALWLHGNPLDCKCASIAPLLARLKLWNKNENKILHLDPFRSHLWDDEDVWEDQSPIPASCASPRALSGRRIENLTLSDLSCSVLELVEITVNRRLSEAKYFLQQPSSSSFYQESQAEEKNGRDKASPSTQSLGENDLNSILANGADDNSEGGDYSLDDSYEYEDSNGAAGGQKDVSNAKEWIIAIPELSKVQAPSQENSSLGNLDDDLMAKPDLKSAQYAQPGVEGNDDGADFEERIAFLLGEKNSREFNRILDRVDLHGKWYTYYDVAPNANTYDDTDFEDFAFGPSVFVNETSSDYSL